MLNAKGNRDVSFDKGEKVMARDFRKDQEKWSLATVVTNNKSPVQYEVEFEPGKTTKRHANQLVKVDKPKLFEVATPGEKTTESNAPVQLRRSARLQNKRVMIK